MWSVIRIKRETLNKINKVKAIFLSHDINLSKDELLDIALNKLMRDKEWKNHKLEQKIVQKNV